MFGVCHFEIPADDVERAQKFYGELFGWKIEKFAGPAPMDILVDYDRRRNRGDGPAGGRHDAAAGPPATDHYLY